MIKKLLVIDLFQDWISLFQKYSKNNNIKIEVDQAGWNDISVSYSSKKGLKCELKGQKDPFHSKQKSDREFVPDLLLIRNFINHPHEITFKNTLLTFMMAGIPSVNSLESILLCSDKPTTFAALHSIAQDFQSENIRIVPSWFYPNTSQHTLSSMQMPDSFPLVAKIGSTHAGIGKSLIRDQDALEDFLSLAATANTYFTLEAFVETEYEIRLQKIGDHLRAYSRRSSSSWKQNTGNIQFEDITVTERLRGLADVVGNRIGGKHGLDMFALDLLHGTDGIDYIIEVNDTAMGLMWEHSDEDNLHIAHLVSQLE